MTVATPTDITQLAYLIQSTFSYAEWDDSVTETARRVLQYWQEFSTPIAPLPFAFTTFPASHDQLIISDNIEAESLCGHHLLPVLLSVDVGYIPHMQMVGLSKIARLVKHLAKRPTTQETLTAAIVKFMKDALNAKGVMVVVRGVHTCQVCRGIHARHGTMTTSLPAGVFLTAPAARQEFLSLTQRTREAL